MAKLKIPGPQALAIEPLLGTLLLLEAALMTIARALRGAYPELDRAQWPREPSATAAARSLVDDCAAALDSLDHFRDLIKAAVREATSPDIPL